MTTKVLPTTLREKLIAQFAEMAQFTLKHCGGCWMPKSRPYRCCEKEWCNAAAKWAREKWGVTLVPTDHRSGIPFMSDSGCIVPPHLRPICTVHLCSSRYNRDAELTKEYFDHREQLNELLAQLLYPEDDPQNP